MDTSKNPTLGTEVEHAKAKARGREPAARVHAGVQARGGRAAAPSAEGRPHRHGGRAGSRRLGVSVQVLRYWAETLDRTDRAEGVRLPAAVAPLEIEVKRLRRELEGCARSGTS